MSDPTHHPLCKWSAWANEECQTCVAIRWAERAVLDSLIGATDAAVILGVTRQRVQQMVDEGKLPDRRVGHVLVFTRGEVEVVAA